MNGSTNLKGMKQNKLIKVKNKDGSSSYMFYCPGCDSHHGFNDRWKFNGDLDKPNVSPSLLTTGGSDNIRCHLYLRNGMIEFCSDCSHGLAGQKIELKEFPY